MEEIGFDKSSPLTWSSMEHAELNVYPNPFKDITTVTFKLQKTKNETLTVYNLFGEEMTELFNGNASAGIEYSFMQKGQLLSPGVYFIYLQSGNDINIVRKVFHTR